MTDIVEPSRVVTSAQWSDAEHTIVKARIDGKVWWIPTDPENAEYQLVLAWVDAGNNISAYMP